MNESSFACAMRSSSDEVLELRFILEWFGKYLKPEA